VATTVSFSMIRQLYPPLHTIPRHQSARKT
jgi:hypothetical protein